MAVTHLAPGKIEPIIYWINRKGHIKLMPTNDVLTADRLRRYMDKLGYMRMAAETLKEAENLQKKLQEQMKQEQVTELIRDEQMTAHRRQQVRDRLVRRMNSAACSVYEKEFIQCWLAERERKHDLFKKRFTQETGYLDALEFDNPDKHLHDLLDRT